MKKQTGKFKNKAYALFALLLMWGVWLVAFFLVKNELLVPSFFETLKEIGKVLLSSKFWRAFFFTLLRLVLAFSVSFLLALALSLLSFFYEGARAFFAPVLSILRALPTLAVILILLVWTSPFFAPVAVTFLVSFPALYSCLLSSFTSIRSEYAEACKAYRLSKKQQIFQIYLPLTLPVTLDEVGSNLSLALKVMVSAEVLSRTRESLGNLLSEAKLFLEMPTLLSLTLLVVIFGMLLEGACALIKKTLRWQR